MYILENNEKVCTYESAAELWHSTEMQEQLVFTGDVLTLDDFVSQINSGKLVKVGVLLAYKDKLCNICGEHFTVLDAQEGFGLRYRIGYGSKYDEHLLDLNLCCSCFDKLLGDLLPQCKINPLTDEDDYILRVLSESPVVSTGVQFVEQVLEQADAPMSQADIAARLADAMIEEESAFSDNDEGDLDTYTPAKLKIDVPIDEWADRVHWINCVVDSVAFYLNDSVAHTSYLLRKYGVLTRLLEVYEVMSKHGGCEYHGEYALEWLRDAGGTPEGFKLPREECAGNE